MLPEVAEDRANRKTDDTNDVLALEKDMEEFGTKRRHHREINVQQINDSLLYDVFKNKQMNLDMGTSASDSIGYMSTIESREPPTGHGSHCDRTRDKLEVIGTQLDGLKDLAMLKPTIVESKIKELSKTLQGTHSERSSDSSPSPSTSSFPIFEEAQNAQRKDQDDNVEFDSIKSLNPEHPLSLEKDKIAIYRHPLFPLLSILFEKCELATKSVESSSTYDFTEDIKYFVEHKLKDKTEIACEDHEVNELMIGALQVLRIHLLELEKVHDLCKDFCNRYITCLRGKMQSENLLRGDYGGYDSDDSGSGGSLGKDASIQSISPMPSIA